MIGVSAFIGKVRQIAARDLTYRIGGVGKDGTCDCIGLIMGAMYELGHKPYDIHSTNYIARFQTLGLKKANEKELFAGQLLYRAREGDERLNDRYKQGGRYDTGDPLDYYHVGVVTSTKPLEIIECTEYGKISGIVVNHKFENWHFAGKLKDVLYDDIEEETPMQEAQAVMIVSTKKGALNIREWPEKGPVIGKAPKGARVELLRDDNDGWPEVRYNGIVGYASDQYLIAGTDDENAEPGEWIGAETFTVLHSADNGQSIVLGGEWTVDRVYRGQRDGESID